MRCRVCGKYEKAPRKTDAKKNGICASCYKEECRKV